MSLAVWLPLTKDLRNQGLSDVTVTNNGATYSSTGGKLGGCYTFDGNDYIRISMPSEMTTLKGTSVAAWVKSTSSTLALGGISNDVNYTVPMCTLYTSGWQFGNDAQNGYRYVSGGTIANTSTWHHVCCTVSDTTITTYLDGVQVTSGAISGVTTFTSANFIEIGCDHPGGDEYLTGSVNDFRIYDHVLSQMEVKELSRGLVLHYPLNRGGWGQENIIPDTNLGTTNWYWTMQAGNYTVAEETTLSGVRGCKFTRGTTAQSGWSVIYYNNINESLFKASTKYKLSVDIYPSVNTNFVVSIRESNGTNVFASAAPAKAVAANKWNHLEYDLTTVATLPSSTGETIYFQSMDSSTGVSYIFRNLKLEEGEVATPWCPNSSDALATTMGLNSTTEYDCSGFCNNGTRSGTFSWTSDTPKYEVSTIFNGTEQISATTPKAEILTLSCWAKTSKNKSTSQFMIADSTSEMCISLYSGCIIGFFKVSSTQGTGSRCTLGSAYKENDWNHFVVVKTGTETRKIYCNGVEQTATSNDYWSAVTGFFISGRNSSKALPFYGEICDVRAYATALSASDVQSLYQNSAYIDSNGNVYGAVHSEV